jgi:hypothetical protein
MGQEGLHYRIKQWKAQLIYLRFTLEKKPIVSAMAMGKDSEGFMIE